MLCCSNIVTFRNKSCYSEVKAPRKLSSPLLEVVNEIKVENPSSFLMWIENPRVMDKTTDRTIKNTWMATPIWAERSNTKATIRVSWSQETWPTLQQPIVQVNTSPPLNMSVLQPQQTSNQPVTWAIVRVHNIVQVLLVSLVWRSIITTRKDTRAILDPSIAYHPYTHSL